MSGRLSLAVRQHYPCFLRGVGGGLLFRLARVILLVDAYVTVEGFVDIGYIAGVECIFGRARWLKTRRTRLSSRAQPTS